MTTATSIDLTTTFLDRLVARDLDGVFELTADDIVYTNVGVPSVRGKRTFERAFRALDGDWLGFDYVMINVSADGPVVLTERIDELRFGRVRMQFWVCGRFEVRDGRVTVWRDYFDFVGFTGAFVRGVVALVLPRVQRPLHR